MQEKPTADQALVNRLRAGEESAVRDLHRLYRARIYQWASRYLKTPEDVEEVTQDVLFRVCRKIDAFRGDSALSSWIFRITFNAAMSRLRTGRSKRAHEVPRADLRRPSLEGEGWDSLEEIPDWSSLPDDALCRAHWRQRVMDALMEVPAIYRLPVVLRDVQGLSTGEASAVLKLKPATLKSRLHRGHLILRERLREYSDGLGLHRVPA
jgi:RNA polymerase sigma-70 factor (ECF subfamily)